MNITLSMKKKTVNGKDDVTEEEMETSRFQYLLSRLIQYFDGIIVVYFDDYFKITLDLSSDFSVCYEEIVESIILAEKKKTVKKLFGFVSKGLIFTLFMK